MRETFLPVLSSGAEITAHGNGLGKNDEKKQHAIRLVINKDQMQRIGQEWALIHRSNLIAISTKLENHWLIRILISGDVTKKRSPHHDKRTVGSVGFFEAQVAEPKLDFFFAEAKHKIGTWPLSDATSSKYLGPLYLGQSQTIAIDHTIPVLKSWQSV